MTVGETVTAKVLVVGDGRGKGWRLTLVDVDHEVEPFAASLLAEGPPWLVPPPPTVIEAGGEDAADEIVAPVMPDLSTESRELPTDVSPSEVAGLRAERDGFLAELESARARVEKLERSREQLRRQAREAGNEADRRRREVQALQDGRRSAQDSNLFLDRAEQLDFEVRLAVGVGSSHPGCGEGGAALGRYVLGPHFLDSWAATEGIDRQKVVDVVVEVLTGRVHAIAGRGTHQRPVRRWR